MSEELQEPADTVVRPKIVCEQTDTEANLPQPSLQNTDIEVDQRINDVEITSLNAIASLPRPWYLSERTRGLLKAVGCNRPHEQRIYLAVQLVLVLTMEQLIIGSSIQAWLKVTVSLVMLLCCWNVPNFFLALWANEQQRRRETRKTWNYRLFLSCVSFVLAATILAGSVLSIVLPTYVSAALLESAGRFPQDLFGQAWGLLVAQFYLQIIKDLLSGGPLVAAFTSQPFLMYIAGTFGAWICLFHLAFFNRFPNLLGKSLWLVALASVGASGGLITVWLMGLSLPISISSLIAVVPTLYLFSNLVVVRPYRLIGLATIFLAALPSLGLPGWEYQSWLQLLAVPFALWTLASAAKHTWETGFISNDQNVDAKLNVKHSVERDSI
ncbi:MAG: hypothetical protein K2W95_26340 [Candidatus Obscuribacterales bacterium]|nr:hypothetical protein [Candidatus Obscuribacterales bacterium]